MSKSLLPSLCPNCVGHMRPLRPIVANPKEGNFGAVRLIHYASEMALYSFLPEAHLLTDTYL
jgi:hypothetical protein